METKTEQEELSRKVKEVHGITIVVEPPDDVIRSARYAGTYGSKEYWDAYGRAAREWAKEFHEFIRDHRSRDPVALDIKIEEQEVCCVCGCNWEPFVDAAENGDTDPRCAGCGHRVGK